MKEEKKHEKIKDVSFKEMNREQKLEYIWDYYKFYIIGAVVAIVIIISLIGTFIEGNREVEMYCAVFNDYGNGEIIDKIQKEYPSFIGKEDAYISVDGGYPFAETTEGSLMTTPEDSSVVKIMTLFSAGDVDVVISDYGSMLFAKDQKLIAPLDEALPKELFEKLSPYYVYADYNERGGKGDGKVYALDISDTAFFKDCAYSYTDGVICVSSVTESPEKAADFVRYVFNMK